MPSKMGVDFKNVLHKLCFSSTSCKYVNPGKECKQFSSFPQLPGEETIHKSEHGTRIPETSNVRACLA
jgi:hypothetical protein